MNAVKIDSKNDLSRYFNDESRHNTRHGQIEYLIAMKYIHKYLRPDMKVLVVGEGGGSYSYELASQGIAVTAVEMLQSRLDELNSRITDNMKLITYKGEICDLGFLSNDSYDITLVMGPMYHLYTRESRLQALSEAVRVTKPNGIIFVSYFITDGCIVDLCFNRGFINYFLEQELLEPGTYKLLKNPDYLSSMVKKKDIDELLLALPVSRLSILASDLVPESMHKVIDNMDERDFELYINYLYSVCEREDHFGSARRCVDILQKKKPLQLRWVKY